MVHDEKPLHVRVAEALGLRVRDNRRECHGQCVSAPLRDHLHGGWEYWKRDEWAEEGGEGEWQPAIDYLTDWSATGPLIERYGISLTGGAGGWLAFTPEANPHDFPKGGTGATPLIAVCNLILALAAAGKLSPNDSKEASR